MVTSFQERFPLKLEMRGTSDVNISAVTVLSLSSMATVSIY